MLTDVERRAAELEPARRRTGRGLAVGIVSFEVPDLRAATDLAQSDPAVAAGVLVYELDELRALFDVVSASRPHAAPVTAAWGEPT